MCQRNQPLARIAPEEVDDTNVLGSDLDQVDMFRHGNEDIHRQSARAHVADPVESLSERLSILLLKPAFGVPTAWAYARWQDSKEIPGAHYAAQGFERFTFVNDLERPAFEKFVFLAELKMWLLKQSEVGAALMSGSGSTVFAVMRPNANVDLVAKRARAELDREIWTCGCETI